MKEKLNKIFDGATLFQILIGVPVVASTWFLWPYIAHYMDPGAATFGVEVIEPVIIAFIYIQIAGILSFFGAKLFDGHFPPTIASCDTTFLLFLLFYCGFLFAVNSVLALSTAL